MGRPKKYTDCEGEARQLVSSLRYLPDDLWDGGRRDELRVYCRRLIFHVLRARGHTLRVIAEALVGPGLGFSVQKSIESATGPHPDAPATRWMTNLVDRIQALDIVENTVAMAYGLSLGHPMAGGRVVTADGDRGVFLNAEGGMILVELDNRKGQTSLYLAESVIEEKR